MKAFGSVFGMTVRVADSPEEWARYVGAARAAGAVDVGDATRTDYDCVIDPRLGLMLVRPGSDAMEIIRHAIPELPPDTDSA